MLYVDRLSGDLLSYNLEKPNEERITKNKNKNNQKKQKQKIKKREKKIKKQIEREKKIVNYCNISQLQQLIVFKCFLLYITDINNKSDRLDAITTDRKINHGDLKSNDIPNTIVVNIRS